MIDPEKQNLFNKIIQPIRPLLNKTADEISGDSDKYKLNLVPFTLNLFFAIFSGIDTIGQLITEIKTSRIAEYLGLIDASQTTYHEAFRRYNPSIFKNMFLHLVETLPLIEIPDIKALGRILLIDGSVFSACDPMQWATYKSGANAIKLHLSFELNRMIPVEFLITAAKFSERKFLSQVLKKGITYVCDRGYISFYMLKEIAGAGAFFIIRGKTNMKYVVEEQLEVIIPNKYLVFIKDVKDIKVRFVKDANNLICRAITFTAMGEVYLLTTNRFDLSTHQVIVLYAYRWQIELFFRVMKRTMKGLHLMSQDPRGVEIQFYIYVISYILLMSFKQKCEQLIDIGNENDIDPTSEIVSRADNETSSQTKRQRHYVCGLVTILGNELRRYWKIGKHWLVLIKNRLSAQFNNGFLQLQREVA